MTRRRLRTIGLLATWPLAIWGFLPPALDAVEISQRDLFLKSLKAGNEALRHYGSHEDPDELRRVTKIAYELVLQSEFRDFPFTFHLIDIPEPNAFALPGGQVFVTRGMLALGLDDDMLACLLGHEIAHVTERHGTRMQRRATLLNVLGQALVLGVLVGVDDDPQPTRDPWGVQENRKAEMVQGSLATSVALTELLLRNYSREFEDEADKVGQRLAAAAGYDPDGARKLWDLMSKRLPQSKQYGYWRTHPFSDQRTRAAELRAEELKIQKGALADDLRAKTQKVLVEFEPGKDRKDGKDGKDIEGLQDFLDGAALAAWPKGPRAETLRLSKLHDQRKLELDKAEIERDYGALVREYRRQIAEVQAVTPKSAFVATLENELSVLRDQADALYPKAQAIWKEGIYQTPFLETFLSNYPTAPEVPKLALVLGNAYSRLRRQTDAVEQFLRAAEAGPESSAGKQALTGLRNLAPYLNRLTALQKLSRQIEDPALVELAQKRLAELAKTYEEIDNGAEYIQSYPQESFAETVRERLELLAQNLYGEVVLYQAVGEHLQALERIQSIMTHAPFSSAAERLRESAVVDS